MENVIVPGYICTLCGKADPNKKIMREHSKIAPSGLDLAVGELFGYKYGDNDPDEKFPKAYVLVLSEPIMGEDHYRRHEFLLMDTSRYEGRWSSGKHHYVSKLYELSKFQFEQIADFIQREIRDKDARKIVQDGLLKRGKLVK